MTHKDQRGFTLHELIIATAIFAVIASMGLPSFNESLNKSRIDSRTQAIYHLLIYGRTQAINLNTVITLCASTNHSDCTKSRDWSNKQLLIFIDLNANGQIDSEDTVLQHYASGDATESMHYRAFQNKSYLQWLPTGTTNHQSGNITYCLNNKDIYKAKILIMNFAGRPYFGHDRNNDGIAENGSGKNLSCTFS
jgi:type IV fimbrial biogenesis protein FimT